MIFFSANVWPSHSKQGIHDFPRFTLFPVKPRFIRVNYLIEVGHTLANLDVIAQVTHRITPRMDKSCSIYRRVFPQTDKHVSRQRGNSSEMSEVTPVPGRLFSLKHFHWLWYPS